MAGMGSGAPVVGIDLGGTKILAGVIGAFLATRVAHDPAGCVHVENPKKRGRLAPIPRFAGTSPRRGRGVSLRRGTGYASL